MVKKLTKKKKKLYHKKSQIQEPNEDKESQKEDVKEIPKKKKKGTKKKKHAVEKVSDHCYTSESCNISDNFGFEEPELGHNPDGEIMFEWREKPVHSNDLRRL